MYLRPAQAKYHQLQNDGNDDTPGDFYWAKESIFVSSSFPFTAQSSQNVAF